MTTIELPIPLELFWFLATLAGITLLSFLIFGVLYQPQAPSLPALARLQKALGLSALAPWLFFLGFAVWALIFVSLTLGILWVIWSVIFSTLPVDQAATWDFRFSLAKLTALTAVLGAVVALPFTAVRLRLGREQVNISDAALFNDKINAAAADLSSRRQVTRPVTGKDGTETILTEWQDDIVTRAAAIDRLEGLAHDRPSETPRIARMLSIYVRELSREFPAKAHPRYEWQRLFEGRDGPSMDEHQIHAETGISPEDVTVDALVSWAHGLRPIRPDMEKAAQSLGRLKTVPGIAPDDIPIDLRDANLQGFDLNGLTFDKALLQGARMEGANLFRARMKRADLFNARMEGANLSDAQMEGADLSDARMEQASLRSARMEGVDLRAAHMAATNLKGARMEGAKLGVAQFSGATFFRPARGC